MSDVLFEENDWVLSDTEPGFKPILPAEGRDYEYSVTYTLFETPAPAGYSGIQIAVPGFDEEKALGEALEEIRDRFVSFEPAERSAQDGDLLMLEYPSRDSGESRRAAVVIGRENMGPGFDQLLPGSVRRRFADGQDGVSGDRRASRTHNLQGSRSAGAQASRAQRRVRKVGGGL
ncbi:MAG: hypothetical protein MZU79_08785 [Anaerotruncus sp.]|nr:hypothetical protein [Anaerotruncus sp.]